METPAPIAPDSPPPAGAGGGIGEVFRDNLFKDLKNSVLTVVFAVVLGYLAYRTVFYVFVSGRWEVVFDGPLYVYMVGNRFGQSGLSYANVWGAMFVLAAMFGYGSGLAGMSGRGGSLRTRLGIALPPILGTLLVLAMTRTITPTLLVLATVAIGVATRWITPRLPDAAQRRSSVVFFLLPVVAFLILTGGNPTAVNRFGGLLLTITVAAGGILLSFPLGVVLALARRSSFPLIRPLAVAYIELIRGVPLITLLFMGQFALGFFFPPNVVIPGQIPRAIIMITLFTAAYVAEIVRGGLQSVPKGQTEAGQALGLPPLKVTRRIVLPQALRNSIPALIGQFISLLKDTSLLVVIGVQELLGVTEPILGNLRFRAQGYQPETFAFVGLIYWIICFSMSRASQRLETRLGVGQR